MPRLADLTLFATLLGSLGYYTCQTKKSSQPPLPVSYPPTEVQPAAPKHVTVLDEIMVRAKPYSSLLHNVEEEQKVLSSQYHHNSGRKRKQVLSQSREFLYDQIVNRLIPAWYGVPWRIIGKSNDKEYVRQTRKCLSQQDPTLEDTCTNCSLFVTTVLKHAGLKVSRDKLARQLSADIIRTLAYKRDISWLGNDQQGKKRSIGSFVEEVKKRGHGLYVIGLDCHTGFLVNGPVKSPSGETLPDDVYFCHASYYPDPRVVKCETATESPVLRSSRCKVIGKILNADGKPLRNDLAYKWLAKEYIPTIGKY